MRTDFMMSSSVMFLLMTSRIRWEPASGAKVRPLRRIRFSFSTSSSENVSIRSDGSEMLIFCSAVQSAISESSGWMPE